MSLFSSTSPSESTTPVIPEPTPPKKPEHPIVEMIRYSLIALLIVIPIRMFIAQPFIVSGASMEETFQSGQYLIVDQVTYNFHNPERGDVIIFRYPKEPSKFFIKRVIGLPGETVTIDGNIVTIANEENANGFVLDEPYIKSMDIPYYGSEILGEREYFVMGDNRDESSDSRAWGILTEDRIIGRAFIRLFPPQEFDFLPGRIEDVSSSS
jgi:signal peptidase I